MDGLIRHVVEHLLSRFIETEIDLKLTNGSMTLLDVNLKTAVLFS
jgi:hypothetical protein